MNIFHVLRILAFNPRGSEGVVGDEEGFTSDVLHELLEDGACYCHLDTITPGN